MIRKVKLNSVLAVLREVAIDLIPYFAQPLVLMVGLKWMGFAVDYTLTTYLGALFITQALQGPGRSGVMARVATAGNVGSVLSILLGWAHKHPSGRCWVR